MCCNPLRMGMISSRHDVLSRTSRTGGQSNRRWGSKAIRIGHSLEDSSLRTRKTALSAEILLGSPKTSRSISERNSRKIRLRCIFRRTLASSAADGLAVQWRLARVVVQRDVPGQPRLAPGGCRVPDGAHAAARFADPPQRCSVRNGTSAAAGASGKGDRDCVAAKEATNRKEGEDGPGNTQA